jgi:hypothetical protein
LVAIAMRSGRSLIDPKTKRRRISRRTRLRQTGRGARSVS